MIFFRALTFSCIASFFAVAPASADTNIVGGNIINQTWTLAGSPYIVAGDVTVPAGAFLTIQAGVEVHMASTDSQGSGVPGRVELFIDGTLTVSGTAASPVLFRGVVASNESWVGLRARAGAASVSITHALFQNASTAIDTSAAGTALTVTSVRIESSGGLGAVLVHAGAPVFDQVSVIGPNTSGFSLLGGTPTLRRCLVSASTGYGIYSETSSALIERATVHGSNVGIGVAGASGTLVTIRDSIITGSLGSGVTAVTSLTATLATSIIYANGIPDVAATVTTAPTVMRTNPLYVSAANLRITSNSPARFAGTGSVDLGALPYTGDVTPGLHGTLWENTTLTAAGSPYAIAGDLTVAPNRTLTIEPGVTLRFATTDLMRARDPARTELVVQGTLRAIGTAGAPITLAPTAPTGYWGGTIVDTAASAVELTHVRLERPTYGMIWRSSAISPSIEHLHIETSAGDAIRIEAGSPTFDGVTIANGTSTAFNITGASPTVRNTVVRGGHYGIFTNATGNVLIENVTINATSNSGVRNEAPSGGARSVTVRNALITNAGGYGVSTSSGNVVTVQHSNLWGNPSGATSVGVTVGAGMLSANPQYVSTTDLRVLASSVCIDAGTAATTRDIDGVVRPLDGDGIGGAAWDIGAYERVLVAACGNGALEPGESCDDGQANGTYGGCNEDCTGLARCGDGTQNGGEQCDDGNATNTDACLNTCTNASCGDGVEQMGVEACDDGNTSNDDACVGVCVAASCGDGHVRVGVEQCDDGNGIDTDACSNACVARACGDGNADPGEQCDDGNDVDTDGCRNGCVLARCGDGTIFAGVEQCDDGNTLSTDACTASCHTAICGDGVTYAGVEECDDGNAIETDGCPALCVASRCGDGFVRAGVEGCDDGNTSNADACTNACVSPTCGDGVVNPDAEGCDDGNTVDADACRNNCAVPTCGDGVVRVGVEQCDDGNEIDTDACTATCRDATCGDGVTRVGVEQCDDANESETDACSGTCVASRCGDGVVRAGVEGCDDGNTSNADACTNACVSSTCGDGVLRADVEQCDDGNATDSDACNNACMVRTVEVPTDGDAGTDTDTRDGGCSAGGTPRATMPLVLLVTAAAMLLSKRRRRA